MSEIIIHSEPSPISTGGPGTVGGVPVVVDFGEKSRISNGIITADIASVVNNGGSALQVGFNLSSDGLSFPTFVQSIAFLLDHSAQTIQYRFSNVNWLEQDPNGFSRYMRANWFNFGGVLFQIDLTLFIFQLIVQTGEGTEGANVYHDISQANDTIDAIDPSKNFFGMLSMERQESVLLNSTRIIERNFKLCADGRRVNQDLNFQPLLFPRVSATNSEGNSIIGLPPIDYIEAFDLFANIIAKSEIQGSEIPDIRGEEGLKKLRVEPEEAHFEVEFFPGRDTDFLKNFPEIAAMVECAFPPGAFRRF